MSKTDAVISAVERLSALKAERLRLTAEIDAKIESARREVGRLVGEDAPPPSDLLFRALDQPARLLPDGRIQLVGGPPVVATRTGDGKLQAITRTIQEKPGVGYGEIALRVYGVDSDAARHRLRAQLHTLKQRGVVRQVEGKPGHFEPIQRMTA